MPNLQYSTILVVGLIVVKDAVATNDFTTLSQELLNFFGSAAGYHREALYGTTDRLKFALVECLTSHNTDLSMFILQALMAVGEMVKTRGLDHELELMVSQFLVNAFCSPSPPLSSTTSPSDEKFYFYGGGGGYEGYANSSSKDTGTSPGPIFMPDVNLQSSAHTACSSGGSSPHVTNIVLSNVIRKSASKNKRKKKAADLII